MSVTEAEIRRIAALARVRVDDAGVAELTTDMNRVLEHMEALRELDADGASDLTPQVRSALASTRGPEAEVPDALAQPPAVFAPVWRDGFFVVPPPPGLEQVDRDPTASESE